MKIGFVGLGIMGSRMAANLLNGGETLTVYNRSAEKATDLAKLGATVAASPAAAAQDAEILITMLAHPEAVSAAALGADGFLGALPQGSLWIDCSTVHPSFAREMAAAAAAQGIRYLDAPVAGSKNQAMQGALVFFVGGDSADVAQATPYFEQMGSRVVHVGAHSQGIALKMVINHLLGTSMAAFAEALNLGVSLGITQDTLLNALIGGPVTPPYLATKKTMLASGDFDTEFPLRWMHKDMQMVSVAAYEQGVPMPVSEATKTSYRQALHSRGDIDFSAIYQPLAHAE